MSSRVKSPTIVDVAREAGVSKSAVSRALLGQGRVSVETTERIRSVAERLGYVPNAMARGLVSQRTMTLGVVLRDSTTQFYGYLQSAMQRRAAQLGYEVVAVTGVDELTVQDAQQALRSLISLRVDGLIVSSAQISGDDLVRYVDRVPIVVAGRAEHAEGIVSVHCDEVDGGTQIARHLLELGHRRVAVLSVPEGHSLGGHVRATAMARALREGGAVVREIEIGSYRVPVADAVAEVLAEGGTTAVMCPSDITMVNVLDELRRQDVPVPSGLSVTGFDAFGTLAEPLFGFSSFHLPVEEIGSASVERLVELIETGAASRKRTAIRGSLVPGRTATRIA